jgi:hypothetical protein
MLLPNSPTEVNTFGQQLNNLDIYQILNIAPSVMSDNSNNVNYWLMQIVATNNYHINLAHINQIISIIEKFHSYFHFEQSFVYTISACAHYAAKDFNSTSELLAKALFQDPINTLALNLPNQMQTVLLYDKNYRYEQSFLRFAIKEFVTSRQLEFLDQAISYVYLDRIRDAQILLEDFFYDSHRFWLIKAIISYYNYDFSSALQQIKHAARMLETSHQNYHQYAARIYALRAKIFNQLGQSQIAKNDLVKARNLCPKFTTGK